GKAGSCAIGWADSPRPALQAAGMGRRISAALSGQQLSDREERGERIAPLLEHLRRALLAIDDGEHAYHLGTIRLGGFRGDERALAARDHVVEDRDALVAGEVALDLPAQPVILGVAT